jgi:hypothetical protein
MHTLHLSERELLVVICALESAKREVIHSNAGRESKELEMEEIVALRNRLRDM